MTTFNTICEILAELLDVEQARISAESYLVRDLGLESIDFLELAVVLNSRFRVDVQDDLVFLRNLRIDLLRAQEAGQEPLSCLQSRYGFLGRERLQEVLADLDHGPVLKIKDLVSYVQWQTHADQAV